MKTCFVTVDHVAIRHVFYSCFYFLLFKEKVSVLYILESFQPVNKLVERKKHKSEFQFIGVLEGSVAKVLFVV